MSKTGSQTQEHYVFLDGLRGVAAILVLLLHWFDGNGVSAFGSSLLAVDFFFLLSGFVIAYSYEEKLRRGREQVPFLRLRLIRLYPLLLLGVVFGFARGAILLFEKTGQFVDNDLLLDLLGSAFLIPGNLSWENLFFPINTPLWSLHFEVLAYVAFYFFLHRAQNWQLFLIALVASMGCFAWAASTYGVAPATGLLDSRYEGYVFGLSRVSLSFVAGTLLFRFREPLSRFRLPSGVWLTALLILPLMLPKPLLHPILVLLLLVIAFPYVIAAGMRVRLEGGAKRIAAVLGDMSYPLYVIHVPLIWTMSGIVKRMHFGFEDYVYNGIVILPTILVLSYIAFVWYDRPVRKYLRAAMKRRAQPAEAVADRRPA